MIRRPAPNEYASFYETYVREVNEEDVLTALAAQAEETQAILSSIPSERAGHRYAEGKWSIKEVVGHLTDGERIFGYRALAFARGDTNPLPGFDEESYVRSAEYDRCSLVELSDLLALLRRANLLMFRSLPAEAWERSGVANANRMTVRAFPFVMLGHERHHVAVLRERYLRA